MIKYFSDDNLIFQAGSSATITMKTWLLLHLLGFFNLIPIVGSIVWLVIYLMIGFRAETAPSIQNYIKLQVIFSVIGIVLAIIMTLVAVSLMPAMTSQIPM